jgi:transposase
MLTPLGQSEGVINMEDWAEIRRLHRSEGMAVKAIARRVGVARNTVRAALAADTPPRYERKPAGSRFDGYEVQVRALLAQTPSMPASVIAERIGWEYSASVLRARVAQLRPLFAPADPTDRTEYQAGDIVQCDLWFPDKVVPVGSGVMAAPPVLTMVAAWSGFIMAVMLPSRTSGDLLAGMWHLLADTLGAVPRTLVWDNEAGIGQHHKLTVGARAFAGTLGTRIYQTRPRDPEAKGVVERANGYLQTSFMPGRVFASPTDFNTQLAGWLPRANQRVLRRTGTRPVLRIGNDTAAMLALPPVAPLVGMTDRVRLGRDYYVRVLGNDYSVDPTVIGRLVDIVTGLSTITDPAHVTIAAALRSAYRARSAAVNGPAAKAGAVVGVRALSDYDDLFALTTVGTATVEGPLRRLEVVR